MPYTYTVARLSRARIQTGLALICLLLAVALLSPPADAVVVDNLFRVETEVADQSNSARLEAQKLALAEVLVRSSGRGDITQQAEIKSVLARPDRLVNSYQYRTVSFTDEETGEQGRRLMLIVDFQPKKITDILRQSSLPIWSSNRASITTWIAVDDSSGRQVVSATNRIPLAEALAANAKRRGLPMLLPVYDMTDIMAVSTDDVWQMQQQSLFAASERYQADAILVGRIVATGESQWRASWTFSHAGEHFSFDSQGQDFNAVLAPVIDNVAEALSRRYAVIVGENSAELQLSIDSIDSFADYTSALLYLRGLEAVRQVGPLYIEGEQVVFALELDGTEEQVWQAISLNRRLKEATAKLIQTPQAAQPPVLTPAAVSDDEAVSRAEDSTEGSAEDSVEVANPAEAEVAPVIVDQPIAPLRYYQWQG
ncbi:hypothetical protein SIN8267_02174 [Sinobacterium norvegicum]|uniref:DUF2066 domain-containing protein n=1 Tax=Sinobacterium norvegicum TaxID=1641715 RepID=A0ABM9AG15_9GAMM|nr:DUF2066 domain-containing protein [Sinobacterium norvegicum]CAH0992059.1 hypothetical protein SIN8267_02174 [Sinobacterium norvegicum]